MRRTGKDVLTLIPFTIILIIPLSPIGHVLVFSFIQRFFPDFFPSCYTEKRLNLRKLYSEIEYKQADFGEDSTGMMDWPFADSFKAENIFADLFSKFTKLLSPSSSPSISPPDSKTPSDK